MGNRPKRTFKALLLSAIILALMMLSALPMVTASQVSTKTASGSEEAQAADTFQAAPLNPAYLDYIKNPSHYTYGYIPPTVDLSHLHDIPVQNQIRAASLPSAFDWRNLGKVTPVKDQGSCGTCGLFGTIAAIESRVLIKEGTAYDFSEQNVACCTDPSWVQQKSDPCNAGFHSFVATDVLTKKGTRLEACDPYNTSTINTESCKNSCSIIKRITGYRLVATSADQIAEVKDAVYNDGPVSMTFYFDWIGNSSAHMYPGYIYYWPNCTQDANHLVCIVGWDDTIAHPAGGGSGAWIVKNSWGTSWGNNGYFYLCYGSGNMTEVASYEYKNYNPYETVYYWDEAGWVGQVGAGSSSAWMASVFTTQQSGNLTNVDFWTTSNDAQYQLYVYDGNGTSGTLLTSQSGTCDELGYYSIPLDTRVARTAGQQFTVAVKMTTPGYNYPLPVEMSIPGYVQPPIQNGVCFVSLDGITWQDAGATLGYNVCLRAEILTPAPPAVSTNPATNIATNSATLNGNLTDMGSATSVTVSFDWGNTTSYGNETPAQVMTVPGAFSGNITGLNPNNTYHFRAKAVGDSTSYSNDTTFTTTAPPTVTTNAAGNITASSATLNGNLTALGTATSVTVSFEWGNTTSYGNETPAQIMAATGTFSGNITGLNPITTYHFRAKAIGNGTSYGNDTAFTTGTVPPSVITNAAGNVTASSAILNGNLTALGTALSVLVSFQWGNTTSYGNETPAQVMTVPGAFIGNLIGINPITTYHFRAKATGNGTSYGNDTTFTTGTVPPTVITNAAGNMTTNSATLNGNLTAMGTATSVTVSFEWGNTTSYGNETPSQVMTGPGAFSGNITGLNPIILYHFRAKAIGNGTSYGNDTTFTTQVTPITGITREVNGSILPGVTITLDGNSTAVSDQSGIYVIEAYSTGSHTLAAHKDGFRDRTQTVNIAGLGSDYAVTYNFQGNLGLIPNAPAMQYALTCVNRWLYPPNPDIGLTMLTALSVINAWLYPIH